MKKSETTVLDIAEYLDNEEIVAEYLNMVSESALDEKAHPRFETIFKVLNAMGIQMTLVPKMKFRKRGKQAALCVAEKRARYKV